MYSSHPAPLVPGNVAIGDISTSSMTITWSHPQSGQYFGYILEYGGTGLSLEIGRTPARSILPRHQNSITLKGLTPNTNYEVRLSSFVDYDGDVTESEVITRNAATSKKCFPQY